MTTGAAHVYSVHWPVALCRYLISGCYSFWLLSFCCLDIGGMVIASGCSVVTTYASKMAGKRKDTAG